MLTKRGIELNIKESKYIYETDGLKLFFSSIFNLNRFKLNYEDYIKEETIKISNKFGLKLDMRKLLIVALYKKIEKRGFYILEIEHNKNIEENTLFELKEI